jgi:hypothetical protein
VVLDAGHGDLRAFRKLRRTTLARLQRVNAALSAWDEYDCAQAMPPDLRPRVRRPTLNRPALKELQGMLCDVIREQEAAWERRN